MDRDYRDDERRNGERKKRAERVESSSTHRPASAFSSQISKSGGRKITG
jgi:hypothetical protein